MPKRKKTANLSRKTTPWDADHERTPLQEFIRQNHIDLYERHHKPLKETAESEVINSYIPETCPNCKSKIVTTQLPRGRDPRLAHRLKHIAPDKGEMTPLPEMGIQTAAMRWEQCQSIPGRDEAGEPPAKTTSSRRRHVVQSYGNGIPPREPA